MSQVHNNAVLQALSIFTGANVKPLTEEAKTGNELNVFNFLPTTFAKQTGDELDSIPEDMIVELANFLDRKFDYDFTNLKDKSVCKRGDELYSRPRGWSRVAIKVLNKYDNGDNTWLGPKGWRSHSAPGEWPVSYHGANMESAKKIIKRHYGVESGIYSTTDIHKAAEYSTEFTDTVTGKTYKVLLQNRINPDERKQCGENGWLIQLPVGALPPQVKRIVDRSVRPYGILFKEV